MGGGCAWFTHQVDPDAGSYQVAHVDVDGVAAVLRDLGQARQARRHAESEHQQRLQQLGGAADGGVEIHLRERTTAEGRGAQMQERKQAASQQLVRLSSTNRGEAASLAL